MQWASADRVTHQSFFEYASQPVLHCSWAKVFIQDQLARGKAYPTAALALAFNPDRFRGMFVCWRDRVPYDKQLTSRVSNAEAHTSPQNLTNNFLKPLENLTNNSRPNP